ncbi:MAG: nickel pincer cofactor biosynthesis protein LarB [Deltaproteobacteria bacterium]|jgi:NCAIR mutase (PurE)-related protein|nr:nickel pincer cofactor biosynthesis protein LarB [Deltaproteobacteria bacterium]
MKDQNLEGVLFDFCREVRIGLPEAVFCLGKPQSIVFDLLEQFQDRAVLFTRLSPDTFAQVSPILKTRYDYDPISQTAFAQKNPPQNCPGTAAVVSAGSADAPAARECVRTLEFLGHEPALFEDIGVAGLWRLAERLPDINSHQVVVVVAGLDAALASVLGGLTPRPLIAVPTSVGYGLAKGGECALSSMLVSCSPGVSVQNIDNGYGAACAAVRILNLLSGRK